MESKTEGKGGHCTVKHLEQSLEHTVPDTVLLLLAFYIIIIDTINTRVSAQSVLNY